MQSYSLTYLLATLGVADVIYIYRCNVGARRRFLNQAHTWFLEINLVVCDICAYVCLCVCVRVCVSAPKASKSQWHNPYHWLNKFNSFYMAALVGIVALKLKCILNANLIGVS